MTHPPKHLKYRLISLLCALIAPLILLLRWAKEPESGLFEFPIELVFLLYISSIISCIGLACGLRGYWLQPKINGLGL